MLCYADAQVLPELQKHFPIQRARMRLKLSVPIDKQQDMLDKLKSFNAVVEATDSLPHSVAYVVLVRDHGQVL